MRVLLPFSRRARVFVAALALDALFGDPPTAAHPVGWIGSAARIIESHAPEHPGARRRYGWCAAIALSLAAAAAGGAARGAWLEALALDATFALRTLLGRAEEVRRSLEQDDLDGARRLLRTHLVSRDTDDLGASEVAGAVIESVAENLGDSVIAPWLAYAALGVPGALAYRAINTLDAMWGYRTERYVDLGRGAARVDDAANLVPARATALAIVVAAALTGEDARGSIATWRRDARRTASPNAGQPMSAMAGALGVSLVKREAYILGARGRRPGTGDIARATRLARVAACVAAAAVVAALARSGRGAGGAG